MRLGEVFKKQNLYQTDDTPEEEEMKRLFTKHIFDGLRKRVNAEIYVTFNCSDELRIFLNHKGIEYEETISGLIPDIIKGDVNSEAIIYSVADRYKKFILNRFFV